MAAGLSLNYDKTRLISTHKLPIQAREKIRYLDESANIKNYLITHYFEKLAL